MGIPWGRKARDLNESTAPLDTARLIARASKGDGDAFGQLLQSYRHVIYRSLWACGVRGDATADDLAQDTALAAWTNLYRLRDPQAFVGWLKAIAANCARGHLRLLALRKEEAFEGLLYIAGPDDPYKRVELIAETRLMLAALTREDPKSIRLLIARAEGLPASKLATKLGLTSAAVRMKAMRSRKRLRERLHELRKGELGTG